MRFEDILRHYDVPYRSAGQHHHARQGWIQLNCPWCMGGAGKFHLGYNLRFGYVNCWKCGRHRLAAVMSELCGISYAEAKRLAGDVERIKVDDVPHAGKLVIPRGLGQLGPAHKQYLRRRGFDPTDVERLWEVKGFGQHAKYGWRIFIPIIHNGHTVSWTTRAIKDKGLRYVSASTEEEAIPHKSIIYGADYARHSIIVVEGPLDTWAIGPGGGGLCGIGFSRSQVLALSRFRTRVICFDSGTDAQRRASQLCNQLMPFPGATYNVQLESGDDPASADKEEIDELREQFL